MSIKHHDGVEREIPRHPWGRVGVLVLILVVIATAGWEMLWRSKWYDPLPVDTPGFWAIQRRAVMDHENPVVIVGSSRALFDTNLDVWEETAGERPFQLALEGTSGMHMLKDLAEDSTFSGTVVVGVTPPLFFTGGGYRQNAINHYKSETPSEWLGQQIGLLLESRLAFIEDNNLPLFTLIKKIPLPKREGVDPRAHPLEMSISKLSVSHEDRATEMWDRVVEDSSYYNHAQNVWMHFLDNPPPPDPDRPPPDAMKMVEEAREYVSAIRSRGGDVVFVRHPSTGPWRGMEAAVFPRKDFWDVFMDSSDVGGVHFEDHPGLQGYELPEWSHISADDSRRYTAELVPLVQEALQTRSLVVPSDSLDEDQE